MRNWQLQAAKARFSELVEKSNADGPQTVTVRGKPKAVVISARDYARLTRKPQNFVEFLRASPLYGLDLDLTRDRSPTRESDL